MPETSDESHTRSAAVWLFVRTLVYAAFFIATIIILLPWAVRRLDAYLPELTIGSARYAGAALFVLAAAGYLMSSTWLVIAGRGPYVEFDPPKRFVAGGPYRWCRNPVAGSAVLMLVGQAIWFESIANLALALLAGGLAHLQVVRIEEPRLAGRFGDSYRTYCNQTPRWLPCRPARAGSGKMSDGSRP